MTLRANQKLAIDTSIKNDFQSGIHYHATGTGKSWIAMYILAEYNKRYPSNNILWICERKNILMEQFSKKCIKERGFENIFKNFNVLNFVNQKQENWYDSINSSMFWGKPFLCIINRSFLTSQEKYKYIKHSIDLIIHDECHSIENNTTQTFYRWINNTFSTKIIGFSATPIQVEPLNTILTTYSIYNGFIDTVILPPKIIWIKNLENPSTRDFITLLKIQIDKLPYKKIIIWCGMIEECIQLAKEWSPYLKDFMISIDFNNIKKYKQFKNYEDFYNAEGNALLFCAVKHREGSDIPNIDGCIFMDLVEKRSERVFIQCMGRVLRKDKLNKKKYGLVIDLKAKSTIDVCNRVQQYLQLSDIFPWNYSTDVLSINSKKYFINELNMRKSFDIKVQEVKNHLYTKDEILAYCKRPIPTTPKYQQRIESELQLIISKNLFGNIKKALEILEITKQIPHITRGSCGSSLICYLLGISHVDPIKNNISFARFLNQYRDNLPDIDFDFPHYLRDEVFLKLFQKWGNKVARISNHNYYHEKSALREALRQNGIHKFVSKYELQREIKSHDKEFQEKIYKTQKKLEGQFRGYSLHCGGIIYFPDGIPSEYILQSQSHKSILPQVEFNKTHISKNKHFKIDILSSRGLSQLYYCYHYQPINFNEHLGDLKTIELLSSGDNIGITLAETPLMRKALRLIKPTSISELAICLAIIRPAAKTTKQHFEQGTYHSDDIIYDDDAIRVISKLVNCDEEMADKLRRGYCKEQSDCIEIVESYLDKKDNKSASHIRKLLNNLKKYGFCKAHAMSYAQLVWQLAYQKAHHPKIFWEATLKNITSCYRKWVHIYEAHCNDVSYNVNHKHKSIYALHKGKKLNTVDFSEQLQKYGYWTMTQKLFYPDCYYFCSNKKHIFQGLIAFSRMIQYGKNPKLSIFLGVDTHKYIEIIVSNPLYFDSQKTVVKGIGTIGNSFYQTIHCEGTNVEFF